MVSCEIANAGKYDMIIPFGWWHEEHPIKNIANSEKWSFEDQKCVSHVEDEGVRHTKHPRRNHYSDEALLAIHTVVAHYHTKEGVLAPAM